jgi:hypothetical protein
MSGLKRLPLTTRMEPRQHVAAATLFVGAVILPVAAMARLWGIHFCLPHPRCRPDEDAISAIAGGLRLSSQSLVAGRERNLSGRESPMRPLLSY